MSGRNGTSRVVDRRLVIVRQATVAVLVTVPVVTLVVLVVMLNDPWSPDGEAHPLLVMAFMVAVGGAGLAGMLLMKHGSRRGLAGIIRRGRRPTTRRRPRP